MEGILDRAYAAKAWAGATVTAVGQVATLVQVAVADEAVSFTEARGIWLGLTAVGATLLTARQVFRKQNAPAAKR